MIGHALTKIQSIINQNLWFDVLSINQHLSKQQIQTCLNMLWNETRGYRLAVLHAAEDVENSLSTLI
jgi:hypothetical protein